MRADSVDTQTRFARPRTRWPAPRLAYRRRPTTTAWKPPVEVPVESGVEISVEISVEIAVEISVENGPKMVL